MLRATRCRAQRKPRRVIESRAVACNPPLSAYRSLPRSFVPAAATTFVQSTAQRCPECGLEIDRSSIAESRIPWLHRHRIGRVRTFMRTIALATFRPRTFAPEMMQPARFREAVLFRRVVVACVLFPIGGLLTWAYLYFLRNFGIYMMVRPVGRIWSNDDLLGSILQLLGVPIGWACLAAFLFAATGACSYFFHPRWMPTVQQNRAIALSYYACARRMDTVHGCLGDRWNDRRRMADAISCRRTARRIDVWHRLDCVVHAVTGDHPYADRVHGRVHTSPEPKLGDRHPLADRVDSARGVVARDRAGRVLDDRADVAQFAPLGSVNGGAYVCAPIGKIASGRSHVKASSGLPGKSRRFFAECNIVTSPCSSVPFIETL